MRSSIFLLLFALLPTSLSAAPFQQVAGLQLQYVGTIWANPNRLRMIMAAQDPAVAQQYSSIELFDAARSELLNDFVITKMTLKPGAPFDLDSSARTSVSNLTRLDGVTNVKSAIQPVRVSAADARRISVSMDRRGGKVGCEGLVIFDHRSGTAWIIQIVFGKSKPLLPFSSIDLNDQRAEATRILSFVSIPTAK